MQNTWDKIRTLSLIEYSSLKLETSVTDQKNKIK